MHRIKFIFLIAAIFIGSSLNGQELPDSITAYYLNAITTAPTDTDRINRLLDYSKDLFRCNVDSALAVNKSILTQSKTLGFKKGIVTSLINLAIIWRIKGNIISSFNRLKDARRYCDDKDYKFLYSIYINSGINYIIQADNKAAIASYYKAAQMAEQSKDTSIKLARLYLNLSMAWETLGNTRWTSYYFQLAEDQAVKDKDSVSLSSIYNKQGEYFFQKKDTSKALDYYFKSLSISTMTHDKDMQINPISSIIYVYITQNKKKKAMQYLAQFNALSKDREIESYGRTGMLYSYGLFSFLLKDYPKAEASWLEAVFKMDSINANMYKLKPLAGLYTLYGTTKQFKKAYHYQQLYSTLKDSVVNDKKIQAVNLLQRKYQLAQKDKVLAQQKLEATRQQAIADQKNMFLIISGAGCMLLLFLLFSLNKNYKHKRQLQSEQLHLFQQEQKLSHLKAVISGAESERKRIAQELHDGVGSLLSVAKMNLSMIQESFKDIKADTEFINAMQLLDTTASELRSSAHNLMPEIVLRGGLEEALQISCEKIGMMQQVDINFQSYGSAPLLDGETELTFYRILRELLHQIIIYTKAGSILLQLNWQEQNLNITIDADGGPILMESFNEEQLQQWEQLNLYIRSRNGTLEIDNAASFSGSTVDLEFNLN